MNQFLMLEVMCMDIAEEEPANQVMGCIKRSVSEQRDASSTVPPPQSWDDPTNINSKQCRAGSVESSRLGCIFGRDTATSLARHWEDLTQKICPSMPFWRHASKIVQGKGENCSQA